VWKYWRNKDNEPVCDLRDHDKDSGILQTVDMCGIDGSFFPHADIFKLVNYQK